MRCEEALVRKIGFATILAATLFLPLAAHSAELIQHDAVVPPWQHGANNDATQRGLEFTVPEVDDLADFHGDLSDPKLVLYVGGNYFFAMAPLVAAFERQHPEFKGRIYWETLPPGLLEKQIEAGGIVTSGNMTWTAKPDAYLAGLKKVQDLIDQGVLTGSAVPYATNNLTIMVPAGNPGHIKGLSDLARPDLHLVMPNPAFEGVARQIETSLKKTGGDALAETVYKKKVADGSTVLTHIHHRQTPLFLMQQRAQAGVTWQSEAIFQEQVGNPISHIDIPFAQNTTAIYAGAEVKGAPHPDAARLWLSFIHSPTALSIFERYGFKPFTTAASAD
jgi:ABC-type molybdate transport system substrate-binding protein